MKKLFNLILPKFVRLPLVILVSFNFFTYSIVPLLLGDGIHRYDLSIPFDYTIPLVPFFLLFYVLAYLQWGGSYVGHCRIEKDLCYRIVTADLIAKFLCLLFFVFLPTEWPREPLESNGFWETCLNFIYAVDKPINLFPSIHCLESWMCFRTAMMLPKKNGWYIAGQGVITALVMASTVLLKQHFVVDILGGIIVGEIGLFLSNRCGLWKLLTKKKEVAVQ